MIIDLLAKWLVSSHKSDSNVEMSTLKKSTIKQCDSIKLKNLERDCSEFNSLRIEKTLIPKELSINLERFKLLTNEVEKAGRLIQESEQLYQTTINSITDWIYVIDKDYKILLVNDSLVEIYSSSELNSEVLIGDDARKCFSFFSETFNEQYEYVFKEKKTIETEEVLELGSKKYITIVKRCPVYINNEVVRIVVTIKDITKNYNLESILKRRDNFIEDITDSRHECIFRFDKKFIITFTNQLVCDKLNREKKDIIDNNIYDVFSKNESFYKTLLLAIKEVSCGRDVTKTVKSFSDNDCSYMMFIKSTYNGGETPTEYYCIVRPSLKNEELCNNHDDVRYEK